ncbi:hypothetical protein KSF_028720 [Reticulibacter mediterranei]|uniref:Uncharacterized protein n=1 Tax=Reticulibacter mediterranei TaxID=2778369 RepID=A0A8J3IJY3_9CHLR|nr:hypothetical protein KSF_028720 [Reticulibacter mediterranei]
MLYTITMRTNHIRFDDLHPVLWRGRMCGSFPIDLQTRRDSYIVKWNISEFGYKSRNDKERQPEGETHGKHDGSRGSYGAMAVVAV